MKVDFAREIAVKALYKIEAEEAYSNIVLDEILNQNREKLSNQDIGFISELVYGVTSRKLTLDAIIQKYSKIKIKKMSDMVKSILRVGAYQIIFLNKVPKSAAVNESVNIGKKYSAKSTGFINAILRKIEKSDYEDLKNIENDAERISKIHSMPEWIVKKLILELGIKKAEEICESSNIKPKISIRVNKLKTSKEELLRLFEEKNIETENAVLDDFIYVNTKNIVDLDEYKKGLFTIQDESAGLTAIVLNPKDKEDVLDCCSAPGGKTTYMAELMNNMGSIDAWDLYDHRLNNVKENAKRLGIDIIKTKQSDSTILNEDLIEKYDRVLLDVPCLGLGVMRRKPDIKWQKKENDVDEIVNIQKNILETCSKYVKKGGRIAYSTCSILKDENEDVVKWFLSKNDNFKIVSHKNKNIKDFDEFVDNDEMLKIYPNSRNDGFFICLMERIK